MADIAGLGPIHGRGLQRLGTADRSVAAAWTARCVNKTVDPGAAMQACFEDQRQLLAERTRYRQSVCPNIQFYH